MDDCIFCRIARGEIPSRKIYEDDALIAFHDIRPSAPVHLLIVPRLHIPTMFDITDEHTNLLGRMLRLAPKLAVQEGAESGFKTLINTGRGGGQEVWHLHMHVLGGLQQPAR